MENEWDDEPNLVLFTEPTTGYMCMIRRVCLNKEDLRKGHLCGYVILPQNHLLYGRPDDDFLKNEIYIDIEIHGGVTYTDFLDIELEMEVPYAIGFDCAHAGDFMPGFTPKHWTFDIYRNISYVKNECIKLAKQLKEIETRENYDKRMA